MQKLTIKDLEFFSIRNVPSATQIGKFQTSIFEISSYLGNKKYFGSE